MSNCNRHVNYFLHLRSLNKRKTSLFLVSGLVLLFFIAGIHDKDSGRVWLELATLLSAGVLGFSIAQCLNPCLNLTAVLGFGVFLEWARHSSTLPFFSSSLIPPAYMGLQLSFIEIITIIILFAHGTRACFGAPIFLISLGSLLLSSALQAITDLQVSSLHILALIFLIENLITLKTIKQNG